MSEAIRQTIMVLQEEINKQELDIVANKRLVNTLSRKIGEPEPYADLADPELAKTVIRADAFYRKPFATAVRALLGMRREPLSVSEIVNGLKAGGFDFEDRGDPEQSARIALGKNSVTFTQIPNSDRYGLKEWYNGGKKSPTVKKAKSSTASNKGVEEDEEGLPPEAQDHSSFEHDTIDDVPLR